MANAAPRPCQLPAARLRQRGLEGRSRPWATATRTVASAPYPLDEANPQIRADMAVSQQAIGNPGVVVLDVRTKAEYNGECFWPSGASEPGGRQGHIPSARHQPIDGLYDEQGAFVPSERLRQSSRPLSTTAKNSSPTAPLVGVHARHGSSSRTCLVATTSASTTGRGPSGGGIL